MNEDKLVIVVDKVGNPKVFIDGKEYRGEFDFNLSYQDKLIDFEINYNAIDSLDYLPSVKEVENNRELPIKKTTEKMWSWGTNSKLTHVKNERYNEVVGSVTIISL